MACETDISTHCASGPTSPRRDTKVWRFLFLAFFLTSNVLRAVPIFKIKACLTFVKVSCRGNSGE